VRTQRACASGFTLIEVLAVVFLMTMLLAVALNFYVDLSNASIRATEITREARRTTAILDRVARDFESALMVVKPGELDPLMHPWIFRGEPRYSESGADQVKFVMRHRDAARSEGPAADVAMVAYMLRPSEEGEGYALIRWYAPGLPEQLDAEFPPADDPGALVLADDLENFGVRFLGEDGEWTDTWDSSQLLDSAELPLAVEINVALRDDRPEAPLDPLIEPVAFTRQVMLRVRPLDMEVLLDPETYAAAGAGGEDGEQGQTLADCDEGALRVIAGGAGGGAQAGVDLEQLFGDLEQLRKTPVSTALQIFGDNPAALAAIREACGQ
jgi:prepilin-type N-terminal cleavage/methylation domain-containing protein